MKYLLALIAAAALALTLTGCAYVHSTTQTPEVAVVDGKPVIVGYQRTHMTGFTLFDANNALTKVHINSDTGKVGTNTFSPGISFGSVSEQSQTTTNFNDLIGTVVGAAVKAAVKP